MISFGDNISKDNSLIQFAQHEVLRDFYNRQVCDLSHISSPVIGQTVQKLVSHWLRLGAMFWKRVKFWGVGGKMLFTVQVYTNWF